MELYKLYKRLNTCYAFGTYNRNDDQIQNRKCLLLFGCQFVTAIHSHAIKRKPPNLNELGHVNQPNSNSRELSIDRRSIHSDSFCEREVKIHYFLII